MKHCCSVVLLSMVLTLFFLPLFSVAEDAGDEWEEEAFVFYSAEELAEKMDSLPEEQLRLVTFTLDGTDYILGRSTIRDFEEHGWIVEYDKAHGFFVICDGEGFRYLYADTVEPGRTDSPILWLGLTDDYDTPVKHCGFDGFFQEDPVDEADPDFAFLTEEEKASFLEWLEEKKENPPDEDEIGLGGDWTAYVNHMTAAYESEESDNGKNVTIPLTEGLSLSLNVRTTGPAGASLYIPR